MNKQSDKLSQWIKGAVKGGKKSSDNTQKGSSKRPQNKGGRRPQKRRSSGQKPVEKGVMRIIPIGGLEEVGKNAMIVEYEKDILVIDMGFQFPEDEMFGVDYVIPDIQYLVERKSRIRGILITHGHLDHIGALPWVLPKLGFPPIYGTKLSLGLVERILTEHKLLKQTKLVEVNNKDRYNFGQFKTEFFRVNHSIPDSIGMVIRCPEGSMVHTGDFKFDFTPADGIEADIGKMAEIGKAGVNIMFSDSTNATKPGHTMSERVVAENLERSISDAKGRIIIACFASLIGRIQNIIDFAKHHNRKIFLSGRSIERNVEMALKLGYLKAPKGMIQSVRKVKGCPAEQTLILTTGSQGEPMAALSRMATDSHAQVKIGKGDTVVVSASPIIGNEKSVAFLVDNLARLGATLVHNRIMDVHTSGHGQQEDLKMMMTLIKPDHLVPVHGNFYMRRAHGDLGPQVGIPYENVHMMDNGNVIELRKGKVTFKHEDIGVRFVVIDGLGQGDLNSIVLKDREAMAQNGHVNIVVKMRKGKVVGNPVVTTKGFAYQEEMDQILKEIGNQAKSAAVKLSKRNSKAAAKDFQHVIRGEVAGLILRKLNRRPLITPVVVHI